MYTWHVLETHAFPKGHKGIHTSLPPKLPSTEPQRDKTQVGQVPNQINIHNEP